MRWNCIKKIIPFLIILLLTLAIELFIFHFDVLMISPNDRVIDVTDNFSCNKNEMGGTIATIDIDKIYVNKLVVTYQSEKNVEVDIQYVEDDYYHKEMDSEWKDTFNKNLTQMVINFNNYMTKMEWTYTGDVTIEKVSIDNQIHFNIFRMVYIFMFMLVGYVLYRYYKSGASTKHLPVIYLILSLMIGGIMIFVQPNVAMYSWDEQIHFRESYRLFKREIKWEKNVQLLLETFPFYDINSMEEQLEQSRFLETQSSVDEIEKSSGFVPYNKVGYIFLGIGFQFADWLGLPFAVCFKLGKFMNLLGYSLIMSVAIWKTKVGKRILAVIALLPVSIFLACQYAYDPAVTAGLTLGIVYLLNALVDRDTGIDFKFVVIFLIAMLYACFIKAIYAPLMLLFLLIPNSQFKTKKTAIYTKVGIVIICMLVMSTFVLPTVTSTMGADSRGGNTSVVEQLQLVLSNPVGYILVLKDTMIKLFLDEFIGYGAIGMYAYLGYISDNIYLLMVLILLFVSITDTQKKQLKLGYRLWFLVFLIGTILLIWTAMYLAFTPVGENTINGVQPRYFIPLLFPLIICLDFRGVRNSISDKVYNTIVLGIPSLVILISIYQLFIIPFCW